MLDTTERRDAPLSPPTAWEIDQMTVAELRALDQRIAAAIRARTPAGRRRPVIGDELLENVLGPTMPGGAR